MREHRVSQTKLYQLICWLSLTVAMVSQETVDNTEPAGNEISGENLIEIKSKRGDLFERIK